jgi:hypothetical protein
LLSRFLTARSVSLYRVLRAWGPISTTAYWRPTVPPSPDFGLGLLRDPYTVFWTKDKVFFDVLGLVRCRTVPTAWACQPMLGTLIVQALMV